MALKLYYFQISIHKLHTFGNSIKLDIFKTNNKNQCCGEFIVDLLSSDH
jgi:hypothetical protein